MPDSGCTRSVIAKDVADRYGLRYWAEPGRALIAANGEPMACEGLARLTVNAVRGPRVDVEALVSSSLSDDFLLAWHDLVRMKVLSESFPAVAAAASETDREAEDRKLKAEMDKLCQEFGDVLNDKLSKEPMAGPPMVIHLRDDVEIRPRRVLTARVIPVHFQEEADKLVQQLLEDGVIAKVDGPTDFSRSQPAATERRRASGWSRSSPTTTASSGARWRPFRRRGRSSRTCPPTAGSL